MITQNPETGFQILQRDITIGRTSDEAAMAIDDVLLSLKFGWLPDEIDRQEEHRIQSYLAVLRGLGDKAVSTKEEKQLHGG